MMNKLYYFAQGEKGLFSRLESGKIVFPHKESGIQVGFASFDEEALAISEKSYKEKFGKERTFEFVKAKNLTPVQSIEEGMIHFIPAYIGDYPEIVDVTIGDYSFEAVRSRSGELYVLVAKPVQFDENFTEFDYQEVLFLNAFPYFDVYQLANSKVFNFYLNEEKTSILAVALAISNGANFIPLISSYSIEDEEIQRNLPSKLSDLYSKRVVSFADISFCGDLFANGTHKTREFLKTKVLSRLPLVVTSELYSENYTPEDRLQIQGEIGCYNDEVIRWWKQTGLKKYATPDMIQNGSIALIMKSLKTSPVYHI